MQAKQAAEAAARAAAKAAKGEAGAALEDDSNEELDPAAYYENRCVGGAPRGRGQGAGWGAARAPVPRAPQEA